MAAIFLAQPIKQNAIVNTVLGANDYGLGLSNGKSSKGWLTLKYTQNCKGIPYLLPSILTASREKSWLSPLPSQQRRILPNRGLSSSELSSVATIRGELPRLLVANPPDGITPPTAATPATGSQIFWFTGDLWRGKENGGIASWQMVVLHPGKWRYCTLANSKLFSFNNTQLADFNSCFSLFKSYNEDIKGHH